MILDLVAPERKGPSSKRIPTPLGRPAIFGRAKISCDFGHLRIKGKRPVELFGESVEIDERRFTNYSVTDILKNKFYFGQVRHKDEWLPGSHQPIIDQDLFDAAQERRGKNRSLRSAPPARRARTHTC